MEKNTIVVLGIFVLFMLIVFLLNIDDIDPAENVKSGKESHLLVSSLSELPPAS